MKTLKLLIIPTSCSMLGSLCAVLLQALIKGGVEMDRWHDIAYLWSNALESISFGTTVLMLFLFGLLIAFFINSKIWIICISSGIPFYGLAIFEMIKDPTSHNLWPIEFMYYALYILASCSGAKVGVEFSKHKSDGKPLRGR